MTDGLFRGFCSTEVDWAALFEHFVAQRAAIDELVAGQQGLDARHRAAAAKFIDEFFAILESPSRRQSKILDDCRARS